MSIEVSLKTREHGEQAMEPFGVDTKDLRTVKMIRVETMIAVGQLLTKTQVPVTPVASQAKCQGSAKNENLIIAEQIFSRE